MADDLTPAEAAALDEIVFALSAPHTHEAIAARLGISRQMVRTYQAKALAKLRKRMDRLKMRV